MTKRDSTQQLFYAMCRVLLLMLPYQSMRTWIPSCPARFGPDLQRVWCAQEQQYYTWHPGDGSAQWCLPPELRRDGGARTTRVLIMTCDEGSTGWALFQFLVGHIGMRVIFFRDPLHRMSNLFTNALRKVPAVLASTLQVLLVHKYRRAPYGGGKFWKGLKESLRAFLASASDDHPLLQLLLSKPLKVKGPSHTEKRVDAQP